MLKGTLEGRHFKDRSRGDRRAYTERGWSLQGEDGTANVGVQTEFENQDSQHWTTSFSSTYHRMSFEEPLIN